MILSDGSIKFKSWETIFYMTAFRLRVLIFLAIFYSMHQTQGQVPEKVLKLKKAGKNKTYLFSVGDEMRFMEKGDDEFKRGKILEFKGDSIIQFPKATVLIGDIEKIDVRSFIGHFEVKLIMAAAGYHLIDRFNQKRPVTEIDADVLRTSLWLTAVAIIIHTSHRRMVNLGGRFYFIVEEV